MSIVVGAEGISTESMVWLARALHAIGRTAHADKDAEARRFVASLAQPGDLVFMDLPGVGDRPAPFDPDAVGRLLRVEAGRAVIEPLHRPGQEQGWTGVLPLPLPEDAGAWLEGRKAQVAQGDGRVERP